MAEDAQLKGQASGRASGQASGRASGHARGRASGQARGQASDQVHGQASGQARGQASGQAHGRPAEQAAEQSAEQRAECVDAQPKTCNCKHKSTPRSEELQRDVQKRLNRAIGQLNGVKAMIDDNRYCGDVLIQLSAAESAIRRVSEIILREHLETCVVEEVRAGNDEVISEVMDLIRRFS